MKTNVATSSIKTHDALVANGELEPKESLIIAKMRPGRIYSRRELSKITRLETSCVAGRVNRLVEIGVLEIVGNMRCPLTSRSVEAVKLAAAQSDLFAA